MAVKCSFGRSSLLVCQENEYICKTYRIYYVYVMFLASLKLTQFRTVFTIFKKNNVDKIAVKF